jgi:S-phase kinase-associated protein 1
MSDETSQPGTIMVKTSDEKVQPVEIEVARVSATLKNMLENCAGGDTDPKPIELQKVDSATFEKVVEWCKHHVGDPNVDKDIELDEDDDYDFPDWDEDWIESLEEERLFAVILAADYLDIKMLLDLGSKRVANILKSLSVPEIRKKYNLVNDFTPEEEERLRKEFDFGENQ